MVTGDSQEEVIIFRDKHTLHHIIYIAIPDIIFLPLLPQESESLKFKQKEPLSQDWIDQDLRIDTQNYKLDCDFCY